MVQPEPEKRPSVKEILSSYISCLASQGSKAHAELKDCIKNLRTLADGLERVHFRTTMGSLVGGVLGAAGGITSIVGLVLAPITVGASLIVTGVGVGVAVTGGAAAGVANITNMVSQSSDRQKVKNVITEFQEKMNFLVKCVKHIDESQQNFENPGFAPDKMGKGLDPLEVVRFGNIAGMAPVTVQALRLARVAEVAAGVFAGLFVAVDVFFVAMDAKELYNMHNAGQKGESVEFKSEVMKFVTSLRNQTEELEKIVMELNVINN